MNSRERLLTVLDGGVPDRPPIMATLTEEAAAKLYKATGMAPEPTAASLLALRISFPELLTHLGNDLVAVAPCYPTGDMPRNIGGGVTENEWGMRMKRVGLYDEFCDFPLAQAQNSQDILRHKFPDPYAPGRYDLARETIAKYKGTHGIVGELETSIFETSWYLTGLEKFLLDMAMGAEYVPTLMDKVAEVNTAIGIELIRLGVDMLWLGDDFGTQTGLLMSPDMWREHFKPRIAKMFNAFRQEKPDIKLAWHSCGSIGPIIPDFIEIGLDILNPLQPLATGMGPKHLKKTWGDKLIFFGGIDVQELLPKGTPDKVRSETRRVKSILGKEGGYITATAHNIQDDTPVENIRAFFEAAKEK